jgi:hypothetical protein
MFSVRALLPAALAFSMLGLAGVATVPSQGGPGTQNDQGQCPVGTYFQHTPSGKGGCCQEGTICHGG